MFNKKAKRATKAEKERMEKISTMPCVACEKLPEYFGERWHLVIPSIVECHHLLSGNKRRGHMFTIPLCIWHHRGDRCGFTKDMSDAWGPSLARSSKAFHAAFGSDNELLARTNKLLEKL